MPTRDDGSSSMLKDKPLRPSGDREDGADDDGVHGEHRAGGMTSPGGKTTATMRLDVRVSRRAVRSGVLERDAIVRVGLKARARAEIRELAVLDVGEPQRPNVLATVVYKRARGMVRLKTSQAAALKAIEVRGWRPGPRPKGSPPEIAPDANGKPSTK
jgi:hypothetical protein